MIIAMFLVLGLIIGSFLNVVVLRLRTAETLLGRSMCRHCRHQIAWYDNVPLISFVLLRGACRKCRTAISWQYPIVEGLTGVLFALVGWLVFREGDMASLVEAAWLCFLFSTLIAISVYDILYMEIPLVILGLAVLGAIGWLAYESFTMHFVPGVWSLPIVSGALGGLVLLVFFALLVWLSHETWMGMGDVWLALLAGLVVKMPLTLPLVTVAFGAGALYGVGAMLLGKKTMKSQVPFGPFLSLAIIALVLLPKLFPYSEWLFLFGS